MSTVITVACTAVACALASLKSEVEKSGAALAALQQQLAAKDAHAATLAAELASAKEAMVQPSTAAGPDSSAPRILELEQKVAELEKAVKVRKCLPIQCALTARSVCALSRRSRSYSSKANRTRL